jgi:hypothetical protein
MLSTHGRLRLVLIAAAASASGPGMMLTAQPNEPAPWATFGVSVAAITDTVFVVANPIENGKRGPAAVHIFHREQSRWTQEEVLPVPEATAQDTFGISMAADDRTLVVGAQFADARGEDAGLAYVFERQNGRWHQAAVLSADDAAANDQFGLTVSLSGETIVVGARLADVPVADAGAAYVFARQNGTWKQIRKLIASDAARGDLFGRVSVDGNAMIVSADLNDDRGSNAGKAYAFQNRQDGWAEVARLTAPDGSAGDEFGVSLALKGETAVFGAIGSDTRSDHSGAAYVFERQEGKWTQIIRLTATEPAARQAFGWALAMDDHTIVVGAPNDSGAGERAGAVYVFERQPGGWAHAGKLTASDAAPFTWFGSTVAINGNRIVVGMLLNGKGQRSGAAYVFERNQATWSEVARLVPVPTSR